MKQVLKTTLIASLTAGLLATSAFAATEDFKVNGYEVTKEQQEQMIEQLLKQGNSRTPELEKVVRDELKAQAVILAEGKRLKVAKQAEVKAAIEEAERQILIKATINEMAKNIEVTDKEIQAAYDEYKAELGPEQVKLRHILVKDEKTAKDLIRRIQKGEDFAKLAKEFSQDSQSNKDAGGLVDWTSAKLFNQDFAAGFANLNEGEMTKTPVKTQLGYHVIRLEGRRAMQVEPIENLREQFKTVIVENKLKAKVADMIKNAKVR